MTRGSRQQIKKRTQKNSNCWHLDLRLLTSGTLKSKFLLLNPSSVWYFTIAALANYYVVSARNTYPKYRDRWPDNNP